MSDAFDFACRDFLLKFYELIDNDDIDIEIYPEGYGEVTCINIKDKKSSREKAYFIQDMDPRKEIEAFMNE